MGRRHRCQHSQHPTLAAMVPLAATAVAGAHWWCRSGRSGTAFTLAPAQSSDGSPVSAASKGLRGASRSPCIGSVANDALGSLYGTASTTAVGKLGSAACLCGLIASLVIPRWSDRHRHSSRARRAGGESGGMGVVKVDVPAIDTLHGLDGVETSIANFVPKIHALQTQAESLRGGELKAVLNSLEDLRKTELRGVFGEVDTLLSALVDAVRGLRESAISIRKSEIREHFQELDRKALAGELDLDGNLGSTVPDIDTILTVHVVGLSHHSAPVSVREKLAVAQRDWNKYAAELVAFSRTGNGHMVPEIGVLSTCNRFELYFVTPELKQYPALESVYAFLRYKSGLTREELQPYLFTHSGKAAINHLFEVSSGLDSLVLGEAQILAQVKACHEHSMMKSDENDPTRDPGVGGKIITKMLNAAIRTGKLVRTKTKIGEGSVSVSSAAVELMMSRCLADLKKVSTDARVCIVGAGKMGRLLLIALFTKHPDIQVTLVNRSVDKAKALLDELSNRGGSRANVAPSSAMFDVIMDSDVVFAATSSKDPIITSSDCRKLNRNVMLIDISVPRNIDASCSEVDGVASYSVDDLKKVVQANAEKRQSEVLKAKDLIVEEVNKFKLWQASQGAVPYLAALQGMAETIRKSETDKMARKLKALEDRERMAVEKLTRHIIDAILEPIYYSMKDEEAMALKKSKIWALKQIFKLKPLYKRRLLAQGGDAPRQLQA